METVAPLLTRRRVLRAAALGAGLAALAACGAPAPPPAGVAPEQSPASPASGAAATASRAATPARQIATSVVPPAGSPVATTRPSTPLAARTPGTPAPQRADATLAQLLARVPARAIETEVPGTLWYADLLQQRRRYGFAAIDSPDQVLALPKEDISRFLTVYDGLPVQGLFGGAISNEGFEWRPALGFDSFQFAQSLHVGTFLDFTFWSYAQGQFDSALITARLRAIAYTVRRHRDTDVLVRPPDSFAVMKAARGGDGFILNTQDVVARDGTLIAARFPEMIDATIDASAGLAPSLADAADYRAAVGALGAVVGAALVPARELLRPVVRGTVVAPFATPSPYTTALPEYRLAGFGFRDDGARRSLNLALVYTDPAAAEAARPILRDRLAAHRLDPRLARDGRTQLLDHFALGEATILPSEGRTVLVQSLPITDERPSLWVTLMQTDQLGFLRER